MVCPPQLAYGSEGASNIIPGDETITFEMEVLADKVAKKKQQKWYEEDSNNWNDNSRDTVWPMEGNLSTHFCVGPSLPVFLLIAFATSMLYLLYALAIPSIADPPSRKYKKKVVEKIDEGKKVTKRKLKSK